MVAGVCWPAPFLGKARVFNFSQRLGFLSPGQLADVPPSEDLLSKSACSLECLGLFLPYSEDQSFGELHSCTLPPSDSLSPFYFTMMSFDPF